MRPLAPLLLSSILLAPSPSRAQPPGGNPFDRYDANKDGKVTRAEVPDRLLGRFDAIDANKDGTITAEEQRAFLASGPNPGRGQVRVEQDIPYAGTTNPRQKLDLLRPGSPKGDGPLPVVVSIHGGAWLGGEKAQGVAAIMPLVASGDYAGVTINYRLTPEAPWPAQIHDAKAAIRWVRANASKYHLDPDRIGVLGVSAGGHLAALLGTGGGVVPLEGDLGPHRDAKSTVRCVVDEFGPSDLTTIGDSPGASAHYSADSPESKLLGGPILERRELARLASPIAHVTKDDPPFLIIHGDKDSIVPFDQSAKLAGALKAAGVDARLVTVEGGGHGGFRNPEVAERTRRFFDLHLRGVATGSPLEGAIPNAPKPR